MAFTVIFVALLLVTPSLGYFSFRKKIPNGEMVPHPCKANYMWGGVGHTSPDGGGATNPFGSDFDDADYKWTETLCRYDSDGDGRTNGEELGDPNCTWREGTVPERVTEITHPGICNPFGQGLCAGRDEFVDCTIESFEDTCDVLKNQDVMSADLRFKEFEIPNTETNYICQYFDLPSGSDFHIVADEGLIDNHDHVHHMILYGCPDGHTESPSDSTPNHCDMNSESENCGVIISLWAVGSTGTCFGDDVGYRIGANGFKKVKLEIHYNNPYEVSGAKDTSGIRVYYQPEKPGVQDLVTFTIGQTMLEIPPGKSHVEFTGSCSSGCSPYIVTKPLNVISTLNHMHYLGRKQKTVVIRNGEVVKVLADDHHYTYDNPISHDLEVPFEILPGDEISTTCTYSSMSRKEWVFYGDGTSDEMCFAFLVAYPAESLPTPSCIGFGPLDSCDLYARTPKYGCDWARFANLSNPEMLEHYNRLDKTCHLDGVCRPECQETVDLIKKHPCMSKEMRPVINNLLDRYHEGARFLGKLHSCDGPPVDVEMDCKADCGHICYNSHGSHASSHEDSHASSHEDSHASSYEDSHEDSHDGDDDWNQPSSAARPFNALATITVTLMAAFTYAASTATTAASILY